MKKRCHVLLMLATLVAGTSLVHAEVATVRTLEKRLDELAKKTGRSKSYYARLAIEEFLEEQEDYLLAMNRLEQDLPGIPIDEVERRLGLVD